MTDGEEVKEDKAYEVKARKGIAVETVEKELARGGGLSNAEQLRSRVTYFTAGLALGSRGFIDALYQKNRGKFGPKRKRGAKPLAEGKKLSPKSCTQSGDEEPGLYVLK